MSIVVVQLLSRVPLLVTPWTAAHQAPLSSIISQSLLKFMSIESVMPSSHLIICLFFLLLPSVFPSIQVFAMGLVSFKEGDPRPRFVSFSLSLPRESVKTESPSKVSVEDYSGLLDVYLTGSLTPWTAAVKIIVIDLFLRNTGHFSWLLLHLTLGYSCSESS